MGPISTFMSADHRRLDDLLARATVSPEHVDAAPFEEFRAGLLRHIGMEEKVLLPAVRRIRGGQPLEAAKLLRAEHGAIAALLVPTPTPRIVARLRAILEPHDALEEGPGGVYETCDRIVGAGADALIAELRSFPEVPLAPHNDGPLVEQHLEATLALARKARSGG
jgi:hypothetical protein